MRKYVSCFPEKLYHDGGFYDGEVSLSDLLKSPIGDSEEIEILSTMLPGESYPRREAKIEGPSSEFNENLREIFELIRQRFTAAAASLTVLIRNCIVYDSVVLKVQGTELYTLFESYRENDRPWAKIFNENTIDLDSALSYPESERSVCYLGSVGSSNYGHWLVDDLARLALLDFLRTPVTIVMPRFGTRVDAVRTEAIGLLAPVGADLRVELIDPGTPLRFTRLTYVTPVSYHPFVKSPAAMKFVRSFGRQLSPEGFGGYGRRLFVTRSARRHRKLLNLDEVGNLLQDFGFAIVDVEDMTFKQQAESFTGADTIVGVMGAAMTNTIFAPEKARVIYLAPDGWREGFYWDLACTVGHSYTVLYGAVQPASVAHGADFMIDCQRLAEIIEALD